MVLHLNKAFAGFKTQTNEGKSHELPNWLSGTFDSSSIYDGNPCFHHRGMLEHIVHHKNITHLETDWKTCGPPPTTLACALENSCQWQVDIKNINQQQKEQWHHRGLIGSSLFKINLRLQWMYHWHVYTCSSACSMEHMLLNIPNKPQIHHFYHIATCWIPHTSILMRVDGCGCNDI